MLNLQASGSYFDIGYSFGIAMKGMNFKPKHANSVESRFAVECVPEVKRSFPELMDEIEGMGFALKCNYKDVLAMVLTSPAIAENHSTVFAVAGGKSGKGVLLAGNYNRHYRYSNEHFRIKITPKDANASIGNTDAPCGRRDGMNSKGLAVSGSSVHGGQIKAGIAPALLIRKVLDRCGNVDEAVGVLSSAKHARSFNFVVADSSGKTAMVEARPGASTIRFSESAPIISTNRFQSRSMLKGYANPVHDDSAARHSRVKSLLSSGMDIDAAFDVLSDHKQGLCEHTGSSEFSTVWSSVFSPKDRSGAVAAGNPCTAKRKFYKA